MPGNDKHQEGKYKATSLKNNEREDTLLDWVVREGSYERRHWSRSLNEVREEARYLSREKALCAY